MTTQVMDQAASQRNWNNTSYLMGRRAQNPMSSASRMTTTAPMATSTYVASDSMPSFSNPFMASSRPSAGLYVDTALDVHHSPESARTSVSSSSSSQYPYSQPPVSSAAASSPIVTQQMYDQSLLSQGLLGSDFSFSTAPSPVNPTFSQNSFDMAGGNFMGAPMGVKSYNMEVVSERRGSQPSLNVPSLVSSQDIFPMDGDTPRGPYAPSQRGRGTANSYNFPSAHSSTSSVSSSVGSGFSQYSGMDGSAMSDYSDVDMPVPSGMMRTSQGASLMPTSSVPAQASMMTQFSSKVSSSVQKKHVCKICEKRFTRPSSLQTHVYSHTGEKPYQCSHPGCGRCFSVVSNLRRHQKIHRNRDHSVDPMDSRSETDSPTSHVTDGDE